MIYAIGQNTKTMYAMGSRKVDCIRELNEKFPSFKKLKTRNGVVEQILPEPIILVRGK